ncbi:Uncharacterised protein [Acinetobacter baumannii]|nr:Uncharacterised protein [Acinetobacter baumannii]
MPNFSKERGCSAASSLGSILSANNLTTGDADLMKPFASTVVFFDDKILRHG